MTDEAFIQHACEQVLRFSSVEEWSDLSEERKVQLGFNLGVMALGLNLTKEESYSMLAQVREGTIPMREFRAHMQALIEQHQVVVDEAKVAHVF